jgi:hypothetical protein
MSQAPRIADLVPGRECGTCTVCCYALPIDTPEMQKGSGVVCEHCNGRGCAIYAARPSNCREYYCGWRLLRQLGPDWRPDLSGVLVSPQNENIPDVFELREGIEFMILSGEAAILRPGFAEFVASLVHARVPVFFAVPGPLGTTAARSFANDALAAPVERRDRSGVVAALLGMLKAAQSHRFATDAFRHAPPRPN